MRIVDLSHRIVFPHWRWKPERIVTSSHADGELFTSSRLHMPLPAFTRRGAGSPGRLAPPAHAAGGFSRWWRPHLPLRGFTHADAPMPFLPGAEAISDLPLSRWCGEAAIVDLTHRGADEGITADDLEQHAQHVQAGDIVLLRTDWDRKEDINRREFWTSAPYTTREAAEWLVARNVKAVGYDYPPDPSLRMNP